MRKDVKKRIVAMAAGLSMVAGMLAVTGNADITDAAKKAKLGFTRVNLKVGEKKKITIKNKVKKATYTYKSSVPKKASVSSKGVITAKAVGKAEITVKQKYKKKISKIGKITVNVNAKETIAIITAAPQNTATAQNQPAGTGQTAPTAVPATNVPAGPTQVAGPTTKPTPEATPDVYTKEVLTIHTTDTNLYSVEGSTCKVDMQYFTGSCEGDYFNGNIIRESSNVIKRYKEDYNDGKTISTARYILKGKDSANKDCSIFIEDNSIEYIDDSHVVTKPTIITDSSDLAWLQTADIQGRLEDDGDGDKTIHVMWNESNDEKLPYPAVKMPDSSKNYNKEIFTFTIGIGASDGVTGADGASASMINFTCTSSSDTFKGKGVDNFADTRNQFKGQVQTLSARYIMEGQDDDGNDCKVYIENNGIDDNGMVTEPTIITDNPKWAWIETAPLHGTVSWSPDLTIHMWTTADAAK